MSHVCVVTKNGNKIMINKDLLGKNKIHIASPNEQEYKRAKRRIYIPIDDNHNRHQERLRLKKERESYKGKRVFVGNYQWFYTLIQKKELDDLGYNFLK